jgi:hypothetical protein
MTGPAPSVRGLRNAGSVACLIGTLVMVSGRFMTGAPVWLVYVGLSVIAFGWGLFGYSIVQRLAAARGQAPKSEHPSAKS